MHSSERDEVETIEAPVHLFRCHRAHQALVSIATCYSMRNGDLPFRRNNGPGTVHANNVSLFCDCCNCDNFHVPSGTSPIPRMVDHGCRSPITIGSTRFRLALLPVPQTSIERLRDVVSLLRIAVLYRVRRPFSSRSLHVLSRISAPYITPRFDFSLFPLSGAVLPVLQVAQEENQVFATACEHGAFHNRFGPSDEPGHGRRFRS